MAIAMNKNSRRAREEDIKFIEALVNDGRKSFRELAKVTGLSYTAVRERILRLKRKGLLDIKPLVSPRLIGNIAAIIKIKTSEPNRIASKLVNCNRVLSIVVNDRAVTVTMIAPSKIHILLTLDRILVGKEDIENFEIYYGKVPNNFLIPLRNPSPKCSPCPYRDKFRCEGCLPIPRIKP